MNSVHSPPPTESEYRLTHDNPAYVTQEWHERRWSAQSWFERTAWKTLQGTRYGRDPEDQSPSSFLWDDPLLRQIYLLDIASFVTAERTSMVAVSGMVRCAPDESSQIHLSTQVLDEARHLEVFCRRLADFGITPAQREQLEQQVTTRAMRNFYDLIQEQVDKKDFIGASLAQNITMEGMAYPIYRYEIKYWSRFDPGLSRIIRGAFADEAHHVSFGEAIMRSQLKGLGVEKRNQMVALLHDMQGLMTDVFEQVIKHYIGLYQEAANNHMDLIGDLEIFPGQTMANLTEEQQARQLLQEIKAEQAARLRRIGVEALAA
jgi:1,2-phenylacetyl-CoA epoxidase catalytic subunit